MDNIMLIPKNYKTHTSINILEEDIPISSFVRNSISKYRFLIRDDIIYLQRKCNKCNNFFTVQYFKDGTFKNTNESKFRYIGFKSGFHNICTSCESNINNESKDLTTSQSPKTKNNETQLNLEIDKNLKSYYKILAIKNSTTLKLEVINALLYYKNHLDNSSKN